MENFKPDIRECSVDMYAEFIDEIDAAFGYNSGWFIKHLGHVLPAPAHVQFEDSSKNLLALHDGKIIGAVGFYPMNIIASDGLDNVSFKLGGVGQVSCLKEYRGRGVMSALLKAGISGMRDKGIEISWLSGLRSRYANFGYDLGGCAIAFHLLARDIRDLDHSGKGRVYTATEADIDKLNSMYKSIPSRIQRDNALWRRHLTRENLAWTILELDGKMGYICYDALDCGGIWEAAGDGDCVLALLAGFIKERNKDYITIKCPNCHTPLTNALYKAANNVTLETNGQLSILDRRSVYDKLLPFALKQCEVRNGIKLINKLNAPDADLMDAIINKLIGFAYSPQLPGFEFLKPLAFFIPKPDEV